MIGSLGGDSWRRPLLVATLGLVVYLPSLAGEFLYDDLHVVVNNRAIQNLGDLGTVLSADPSRPLLSLTFALNHAVWGLAAWHYHLVNVLIHAGNAALLLGLFSWMARRTSRPAAVATVAACFFAASPMAAETVAYVSSRSTALSTLFTLASLNLAVRALEGGSPRRLVLALGIFLLGLASKEEAAALPLLLLLLDHFYLARGRWRETIGRWAWHLPFLSLPILALAARRALTGAWLPEPAIDRATWFATQVAAFPGYLVRTLLPFDPALYRGVPPVDRPPDVASQLLWLLSLAIVLGAVALARRHPDGSFAVMFLLAGLLPSSSIQPLKEMVVDHRAYLAGAGICFALGGLLWRLGGRPLAVAVTLLLAMGSVRYQWVLANPVRAWQDAVARAPRSAEALRALADVYAHRGDPRAESSLQKALVLDDKDPRSWANLSVYYAERQQLAEAVEMMTNAATLAPDDARIRDNLGLMLLARGDEAGAQREFEAACAGQPALAQPRINLARILLRHGDRERARVLLEEAERLEVDSFEAEAILDLWRQFGPP
jgi:protein O-mannosyl-transferase